MALTATGGQEQAIAEAIAYLQRTQRVDGGWTAPDHLSSVLVSSVATHAVWLQRRTYPVADTLGRAAAYLTSARERGEWNSDFIAAHALLASCRSPGRC